MNANVISSRYASALENNISLYKSLKKADKSTRTLDGCVEILARFWDVYKEAYVPVVKACGACLPASYTWADDKGIKPSSIKAMWVSMSKGNLPPYFKNSDNKVCIVKTVKIVDEATTIMGRDGKECHPYMLDEDGNVMTQSVLSPVKYYTPSMLWEWMLQIVASCEQAEPAPTPAEDETAPTVEAAPTAKEKAKARVERAEAALLAKCKELGFGGKAINGEAAASFVESHKKEVRKELKEYKTATTMYNKAKAA